MTLSDLTVKKRKIVKLIVEGHLDIGHLVNTGITIEDAIDLVNQGYQKHVAKMITNTTDDINA